MSASKIQKLRNKKGANAYTQRDLAALLSFVRFRCLSADQLYRLHYQVSSGKSTSGGHSFFVKKFRYFKKDGIIQLVLAKNGLTPDIYSLTGLGYRFVKEHFPDLFFDAQDAEDQIFSINIDYRKLNPSPSIIPHQYYLNNFAIDLLEAFHVIDDIKYIDERHMTLTKILRPDGLILIPEKKIMVNGIQQIIPETRLFLECDMGTERLSVIANKCSCYRRFLASSDHNPNSRVAILFICKSSLPINLNDKKTIAFLKTQTACRRESTLRKCICDNIIDMIGDNTEVLVGGGQKLLEDVKRLYLHDYLDGHTENIDNTEEKIETVLKDHHNTLEIRDVKKFSAMYFQNDKYAAYAKEPHSGKLLLFLDCRSDPLSAIHKIQWHKQISQDLINRGGKQIELVAVANNLQTFNIINQVCMLEAAAYDHVLCTTMDRLRTLPLHKALFKVRSYGTAVFNSKFDEMMPANIN